MTGNLFDSAIEFADVAMVVCDAAGNVVIANHAARELFGQDRLQKNHPLFRALETDAPVTAEYAVISQPGANRTVLVSARPLFDDKREKTGAVAICAPLTGGIKAQYEEANKAKKQLELLLESTGEGLFGIDLGGRCTFVNGSAAAMLGYRREDLLGRRLHELIHHTDAIGQPYPASKCPVHVTLHEARFYRIDDEFLFRADGSRFPVEYSSYPILDEGALRGAVVVFSDTSGRKKIEAALRESEARYRTLFESISEGIYQTSPNGEVLRANKALVGMLGYESEAELRALDVHDFYARPEDRQRLTKQLEQEGNLVNVTLELKRKDGHVIRVIENARAVRDDRQRVLYYEGTLKLQP
ncbi:MAG TPA: PAS domain S-box protein [Bryobacteraceae bacterium]|nr:PAS domain S-box protein [Bryobacteraceae bacterium]